MSSSIVTGELARVYQSDGQIKKATELLEKLANIKAALVEDHPTRLASQHELGRAYLDDGQVDNAIGLLERVVVIQEYTLLDDHPHQQLSRQVLARAYQSKRMEKEASAVLDLLPLPEGR